LNIISRKYVDYPHWNR